MIRQVAQELGIDQALVSKFESGARKPTKVQLKKLAQLLQLNEQELIVAWLKEKILYEIGDEDFALEALMAAEEELKYKSIPVKIIVPKELKALIKDLDLAKKKLDKQRKFDSYRIAQALELIDEAVKPVEYGLSWAFEGITKATYGRRLGELHLLGAGVGIGKTDFTMQQIAYDIMNGIKVGTFMLEQKPVETIKRIAGKIDGKLYHLPNEGDTTYDVHIFLECRW